MNSPKLILVLLLLFTSQAVDAKYIKHKTPENEADVYITLPSAAYDSIMVKSARYHCMILNVEDEYAPLSLAMAALDKKSPVYKEKEEDLLSKIEQINEKKKRVHANYEAEMKPLLNDIIAGTEVSFKNNSDRIKLTGLSVKKYDTHRSGSNDWLKYKLWFDYRAINEIPMEYSNDNCGGDDFWMQWNAKICDSKGNEISMVKIILTGDEYFSYCAEKQSGKRRIDIIRQFNKGTSFGHIFYVNLSEIYDHLYNCNDFESEGIEFTSVTEGFPKPPVTVKNPKIPVRGRTVVPSTGNNTPGKDPIAAEMPQKEPAAGDKPKKDGSAGNSNEVVKPLVQQNFVIKQIGTHYSEGFMPARADNNKWGYLNVEGKWAIAPQYIMGNNSRMYFSDGVAVAFSGSAWSGNFILVFKDGKNIMLPKNIQAVSDFCNGYAMVRIKGEGWKSRFGYIDKSGKEVFPHLTKIADGSDIYPLGRLSEGLMRYYDAEQKKFGYIDEKGQIILQPQWEDAGDFSEGLSVAYSGDWGFIDKYGNWAIMPQWSSQDKPSDFHNGYAAVYENYIDKKGEKVKELNYPYPFVGEYGYNTEGSQFEMISKSMGVVESIKGRYYPGTLDKVRQVAFPSGYCTLQKGSKPGEYTEMQATLVVDKDLNILLDTEKTDNLKTVGNFYDGRAAAFSKEASDWASEPDCVVDITGKIIFRIEK